MTQKPAKVIGIILLVLSITILINLLNGVPASGIVKLVDMFHLSAEMAKQAKYIGSVCLLMLSLTFAIRALIFNKVCIGKQCSLE